jgi:hypothetical protein
MDETQSLSAYVLARDGFSLIANHRSARMFDALAGGQRLVIRSDIGIELERTNDFDTTGSQQMASRLRADCRE